MFLKKVHLSILCWFDFVQWLYCFSVTEAQHSSPNGENALGFGVLFLCVSVGRESRASLWHTPHDSLTPFNSSHGKTLRSLLSVSLRGVCLPFHHPAFIPVFLSQQGNILASPFLFLHTFWAPLRYVLVLKSISFSSLSLSLF